MPRDRRYSSARWRKLREQVIKRDGGRCAVPGCTSEMSLPGMKHVDHVVEVKDGGDFWSMSNLRTVCRHHHFEKSVSTLTARATGQSTRKIRQPYDPANPPRGCTCNLRGKPTPRSPNDLFCPTCEAIIESRRKANA